MSRFILEILPGLLLLHEKRETIRGIEFMVS
jgi:hypothetical protein